MTGDAFTVELDLRRRLLVTGCAAQFYVRAAESEAGLLAMIEFPHAPAIGRVALLTFLSEASLVNIRFCMACEASGIVYPERFPGMTLLARNRNVQAQEREFRQIVIEVDHRPPTLGRMTIFASDPQPGAVNVARAVTADAIRRQLVRAESRRVTSVAIHARVFPDELPTAIACMVERGCPPLLRFVAAGAVRSHACCMNVLAFVAADAVLWQLVLQIPRTMAVPTVQVAVRAFQSKPGFLEVIEARGFPTAGGMTTGAFRTALPAMHVIGRMAGDALRWRPLVPIAEMTLHASDGLVFVV
jgi:hypothetical protein